MDVNKEEPQREEWDGLDRRRQQTVIARGFSVLQKLGLVIGALLGFLAVAQLQIEQRRDDQKRVIAGEQRCRALSNNITAIKFNHGRVPEVMYSDLSDCQATLRRYREDAK